MEFGIGNLFINEFSGRLNYASNTYNTNSLISWKERGDILAFISFLNIYAGNAKSCICYCTDNRCVNFVAVLHPEINFEVFGGREVIETKNVKYRDQGPPSRAKDGNELLFMNLNTSDYWALREDELNKRGLSEVDVNRDNLNGSKYSLIKDALLEATKRNEEGIALDMKEESRVLEMLLPQHAFMRFRLPYNSSDNLYVEYFKGIVYFPIWGKEIQRDVWLKPTFESRPVGRRTGDPSYDSKGETYEFYETGEWNTYDYESWMFHHNIIERQQAKFINFFTGKPENMSSNELTNGFDSMAEALILAMYNEKRGKGTAAETLSLSKELTDYLNDSKGGVVTLAKLRFMRDMKYGYTSDVFV